MDKRMKVTFAVVLALAFALSFAIVSTDSNNDATDSNEVIVIDKDKTIADGETFELNADYEIKSGVTITFETGSILHIDITIPWSIKGEAGSALIFEEGATVQLTAMGFFERVNVLDDYTSVAIDGKISYGYSSANSKLTASITVDNGTKAVVDGMTYNFKATSVAVAPEFKMVGGKLSEIKGDVKIKSDGVTLAFGEIAIGSIEKIDISVYASYAVGDSDYSVALKGDAALKAAIQGIVVEISEKVDITAGLKGIIEDIDWTDLNSLKDVIPYINGSMSGDLKINADVESIKIDDAEAQYSANFSEKEVKITFGLDIETISLKYGGVEGYINSITVSDELKVELGSFMELLSMRNIIGSYIFAAGYDAEIGKEAIEEFMTDFLTPAFPDGDDVEELVDGIVEQIPEEQMYMAGITFAYSLYFIETVDGLDFAKICVDSYNSTTETGIISKHLEYIELVAKQIAKSITGIDDYKTTTVNGFGTFAIGTITVDADDKGYHFGFDGLAFTLTFDDGIEAEGSFGSIQIQADSQKVYADVVTPAFAAECSIDNDGLEAKFTIEGDLKFTLQDKSNDAQYYDMSYAFNGIKVSEEIELDPKVAKITTSESIKSASFAIDDVVITTGSMSENSSLVLDSGSFLDIFSMRNLDNLVEFILNDYNPEMSESSFKLFLMDVYATAYPSEETEALIEGIIENTPEEIMPAIGFECQFIYFVFEKEDLVLHTVCADIAKNIEDLDSPEGMIEYISKVAEKIFEVETGIEDFQMPSVAAEYHQDIGEITVKYDDETLVFNGASANFELEDGSITANYRFKGLEFSYLNDDMDVQIVLPTVYVMMNDSDGLYGELTVKGDFVFRNVDPQDIYSSYILSIDDIDSAESFAIRDGKLELTSGFSFGTVYGYYGEKDTEDLAFFTMDGTDLVLTGTIDLASLIEAIATGDYSKVIADLEIDGSIAGMMFSQMLESDSSTDSYKAAIDEFTIDVKASNGEEGIAVSGTITLDGGYYSNDDVYEAIDDTELNISFAEGKGTVDLTGGFNIIRFDIGEANYMLTTSDLELKCDIALDEDKPISINPTAASAHASIWNEGITTDLGKVTMTGDYSKGDYQLETDKAEVSGTYTGKKDLKSVSGYVDGIVIIPSNDSELMIKYTDAKIEYTMNDGKKMVTTLIPNDTTKVVDITCATSGDGDGVIYDPALVIPDLAIYDIFESAYYDEYKVNYIFTGDVPLVMEEMDLTKLEMHGKVYFTYGHLILKDGSIIDFKLNGAVMCYDSDIDGGTGLSIAALPGYTLSGEYSGFTVNEKNVVTDIDFVLGTAICSTQSVGNKYTVTINNEKIPATFGEVFIYSYTGGDEPLWFLDEDGKMRGIVSEGALRYCYDVVGNITLTPEFGTKAATGQPGSIVKVDDDAFFVQPADEPFIVQNKSGVAFLIDGTAADSYYKYSATETKYDGMKAYEIKGTDAAWIYVPISNYDALVYHIMNGVEVPMATEIYYNMDADQYFALFYASSYSVYAIDEFNHDGGSSDSNVMLYVVIAIVVLVIIAIAAVMASKKKQNA